MPPASLPLLSVVDSAVAVVLLLLRKVLSGHPRDLINVADAALSKAFLESEMGCILRI